MCARCTTCRFSRSAASAISSRIAIAAKWRIKEAADAAQAVVAEARREPLVKPLTLAYSPCPNDTFIFTPWVEGHIPDAPPVVERFEDIDTLNQIALRGEPDVVKVSFHALGHLRDRYCLLRSGGALGRGCGPLVVARTPFAHDELASKTVAIPGKLTTAALLVRLFAPAPRRRATSPSCRSTRSCRPSARARSTPA